MDYDVVIVGAGFAGLACAREIARHGLRALVLEKKASVRDQIHTTGILVKEAQEEWTPPRSLVREIRQIRVYGPSLHSLAIERDDYFFLATDTAGLLDWLQKEVEEMGVDIRSRSSFRNIVRRGKTWFIEELDVACRFLVGADGARSQVAKSLGLSENIRYLKGVEYAFEPGTDEELSLHCFVNSKYAPGYIGWVLPGVGVTQVGLAHHSTCGADLAPFLQHVGPIFGLSTRKVLERRGGIIPIGGLLNRFYRDGAILVGDAAGMVSPLTAGGIHRAYRYGRLTGVSIARHLLNDDTDPGRVIEKLYPQHRWQHAARWIFDHLPTDQLTDLALRLPRLFGRIGSKIFFDRKDWIE